MTIDELRRTYGLYVIDYGQWIKVGKTKDLRERIRTHWRAGGGRTHVFLRTGTHPFGYPKTLDQFEGVALHMVAIDGGRPLPGTNESFTGLSFEQATQSVRDVCAPRGWTDIPLARLTEEPKP